MEALYQLSYSPVGDNGSYRLTVTPRHYSECGH